MNRLIVLLLLGFICCTTAPEHKAADTSNAAAREAVAPSNALRTLSCDVGDSAQITGEGVGPLRIGAPLDSVKAKCKVISDTLVDDEGEPSQVLKILIARDTASAVIHNGRIIAIHIRSGGIPTASTLHSVRVGDLVSTLKPIQGVVIQIGEGTAAVTAPALCGLTFTIGGAYELVASKRKPGAVLLGLVPDSLKVTAISVIGCERTGGPR